MLAIPAVLMAGQSRFARLGEFDGKVEVQVAAADPWTAAQRNLVLPESAWLRTSTGSRLEIELDEGSAWRLGPDSLGEISDYTRLSTGQRVTLLSLDHGLAYFTGEPAGNDALTLAVPGAQLTLHRGSRLRLEAQDAWSQISIIEGSVRFSSPAAELDLREGQTVRVEPNNNARFYLYREIAAMELDRWSEDRDKILEAPASARHVVERYGLADLDANGEWIQTEDLGTVWKPKVAEDWTPYRNGRWQWYDALGYTWSSDESWGWLPYHFGRWAHREKLGWVWAPGQSTLFEPAQVYWLQGAKFAGWGPLEPGEVWSPTAQPHQFLNAYITYAAFQQDARTIDPAGFKDRPKEPLGAAIFAAALPSPAFAVSRLEAVRPVLKAGSTRVIPVLPGVTYQDAGASGRPVSSAQPSQPDGPPVGVSNAGGAQEPTVVVVQPPPPQAPPPPQDPVDVYYPAPVYTGVVIVNPPERDSAPTRRRRDRPSDDVAAKPAPSSPPLDRNPNPNPPARPTPAPNPPPASTAQVPPRREPPVIEPPKPAPPRPEPSNPVPARPEPPKSAPPLQSAPVSKPSPPPDTKPVPSRTEQSSQDKDKKSN
jgi:hypothetical protein